MNAIERAAKELAEARKALLCLALEVPPQVHADVRAKVEAAFAALAAEPAERADQWPKLIESGPVPKGRLVIYGRLDWSTWNMCSGPMSENSANEWRLMGFQFYDYGPLPLPPQEEQARG